MSEPSRTEPRRPGALVPGLERLRSLLARPGGLTRWDDAELLELFPLYRRACTVLARLDQEGENPAQAAEVRGLVGEAQQRLFRPRAVRGASLVRNAEELFLEAAPRAIRAEWRLLALSFTLLYSLALVAWMAVRHDLDLAHSLLHPSMVEQEMEQLAQTAHGEPFRGNFTFGIGEAPLAAGWIVLHNLGIGIVFFASALLPPLYLYMLSTNALMLGAYTGVASHWGQAGAISSILWTHGVLEIQALVLVGTAGLVLVRAWIKPGAYSRRHALVLESRRALELFVPVFPMLIVAGLIEGFVSPHMPLAVRISVAVASGVGLVLWVALGGRNEQGPSAQSG